MKSWQKRKCDKCGEIWVCKGEGYLGDPLFKKTGICPYANLDICSCEKCTPRGGGRVVGCEEIDKNELKEVVQFT